MKRVAIHSLGCKVNSYESEAMEQLLQNAGYEIVSFGEDVADVYIINTCSVTNIADRKSRQMLHRAKKMNPESIVIATGCYAQSSGNELQLDAAVDIVVGNNRKISIVQVIEEYNSNHNCNSDVIDINKTNEYEELQIAQVYEHTRAYIKIQDGCNQFCSYCIIPYARGRVRSREFDSVIDEVKRLVLNGYKEIVLTGIHLSSYGVDLENTSLLKLIVAIHEIEGLKRIRIGSLEPRIITQEFATTISKLTKVCPHFHLSLQSGCDETLKRMNRRYDTKEYNEKCELLRKVYDNPAITTDVIVGFPGETDEEFQETKRFLKKIHFYEMHVFKYSKRKGTVADTMPDQVDEKIKNSRSNELLELTHEMSKEFRDMHIGRDADILFEENVTMDGIEYIAGHTKDYIRVMAKIETQNDNNPKQNDIVRMKLTQVLQDGNVIAE